MDLADRVLRFLITDFIEIFRLTVWLIDQSKETVSWFIVVNRLICPTLLSSQTRDFAACHLALLYSTGTLLY